MSNHDKKYFVCNNVGIILLLTLLLKDILINKNTIAVYYLVKNRYSAIFKRLSRLTGNRLSFVHINDISQMQNENGVSLIKATSCDDLYKIIENLEKSSLKSFPILSNRFNNRLKPLSEDLWLYIKQKIAFDIYDDLLITNIANWYAATDASELSGKDVTLLLEKRNYWSFLAFDFAKSRNVLYRTFAGINIKKNKGIMFIYFLGKLLFELLRSAVMLHKTPKPAEEAKVGIPFYVMNNFTNFIDSRNYYLFWQYGSQVPPDKIMIYITEKDSVIGTDEISRIRDHKFNIVSAPRRIAGDTNRLVPRHTCSLRIVPLTIQYIRQIITLRRHVQTRDSIELWKLIAVLLIQLPYWEDLFQSNNIKIKFRFHDAFSVREIAAKLSGAATLSYHYSNHLEARITREDICDAYFIWGKKYENCLTRDHSTTRYLIHTGYIFDYTFRKLRENGLEIRKKLQESGTAYIISILDENMAGSFGQSILHCYKALLNYAKADPEVGIIIKPKKDTAIQYLRSSPEIYEAMSILETEGRLVILDSNKYPIEAGHASDIVIGVIPDSTAGLECTLNGIPMAIYDCTNRGRSHPLYDIGYNKLVFDDMEHLLRMINTSREAPAKAAGFADWSLMLDGIDPFRDGQANQRIGAYIETLLHQFDDGLPAAEALKAANSFYADSFGKDKVVSLH